MKRPIYTSMTVVVTFIAAALAVLAGVPGIARAGEIREPHTDSTVGRTLLSSQYLLATPGLSSLATRQPLREQSRDRASRVRPAKTGKDKPREAKAGKDRGKRPRGGNGGVRPDKEKTPRPKPPENSRPPKFKDTRPASHPLGHIDVMPPSNDRCDECDEMSCACESGLVVALDATAATFEAMEMFQDLETTAFALTGAAVIFNAGYAYKHETSHGMALFGVLSGLGSIAVGLGTDRDELRPALLIAGAISIGLGIYSFTQLSAPATYEDADNTSFTPQSKGLGFTISF